MNEGTNLGIGQTKKLFGKTNPGQNIGWWLLLKNGHMLAEQNRAKADEFALAMILVIEEIKADGHMSIRAVTAELNRLGVPAMKKGESWYPNGVQRLLKRIEGLPTD
ncbi:hypothetical protein MJD09_00765 [bacterium]|nr:hypothetical protein [bacterium]